MQFTDNKTSFELLYTDQILIKLNYDDINKTGIKYIFSLDEIEFDIESYKLNKLYYEDGSYIYEIIDSEL